MPGNRSIVFVLLLATALAGCVARSNSPFARLSPYEARALVRKLAAQRDTELQADFQKAFAHRTPTNILILSGGDANGAFGCGILAGWREAPAGRPKFDVVTGVSTGALIAIFAFLGEPQDDDTLRQLYTAIRDRDIFDGPPNFSPNSIFDTGPLKRLIAAHVTPEVLRRIAAAHAQGRRLYVSTVELESGTVYPWPLSKIAFDAVQGNPAGTVDPAQMERFRKILLATAAIPFFFPPVEIDGGLHVDAGLREAVTLRPFMLGTERAPETQPVAPLTLWAILNGKLRSAPSPVANNPLGIGARSLDVYNESLIIMSFRDAAHVAAEHRPPFDFRWLGEPDELDAGAGPSLFGPMFDPPLMRRLYDAGRSLGKSANWQNGPPLLDGDLSNTPPPDPLAPPSRHHAPAHLPTPPHASIKYPPIADRCLA